MKPTEVVAVFILLKVSFYFRTKVGSRIIIFLCDYDLIKTAFNKAELSGRPDFYSFQIFNYFENAGKIDLYTLLDILCV